MAPDGIEMLDARALLTSGKNANGTLPTSSRGARAALHRGSQHVSNWAARVGWRLEAQGFSRTLIEPQSNRFR